MGDYYWDHDEWKEAQMERLFEAAEAKNYELEHNACDTISRKMRSITIPKLRKNISRRNQDRKDAILSIAFKLAGERKAEERRQSAARKIQHFTRKYKGKAGKVKRGPKSKARSKRICSKRRGKRSCKRSCKRRGKRRGKRS